MVYRVSNRSELPYTLCETDAVRSVMQNVALILRTKRGTAPLYRAFGLPMAFVGKPIPAAEALAAQEISDALEEYEPRATLREVKLSGSTAGVLKIEVEVEI